jgi:hypothetical protein
MCGLHYPAIYGLPLFWEDHRIAQQKYITTSNQITVRQTGSKPVYEENPNH